MNINISCKHCQRFLFEQAGTVVLEKLTCPGCKAKLNFKIVTADRSKDVRHTFVNPETEPKKKEPEVS
jgi:phage FluMu protein Com